MARSKTVSLRGAAAKAFLGLSGYTNTTPLTEDEILMQTATAVHLAMVRHDHAGALAALKAFQGRCVVEHGIKAKANAKTRGTLNRIRERLPEATVEMKEASDKRVVWFSISANQRVVFLEWIKKPESYGVTLLPSEGMTSAPMVSALKTFGDDLVAAFKHVASLLEIEVDYSSAKDRRERERNL